MFGDNFAGKKNGMNKMMSYMVMSDMMKGTSGTAGGNAMLPMMILMGGGSNPFADMFSFDDDTEETDDTDMESEVV